MTEESDQECDYHKPLNIDCDRFTILWNALEGLKGEHPWEQSELNMLNAMQNELETGIVELKDVTENQHPDKDYTDNDKWAEMVWHCVGEGCSITELSGFNMQELAYLKNLIEREFIRKMGAEVVEND